MITAVSNNPFQNKRKINSLPVIDDEYFRTVYLKSIFPSELNEYYPSINLDVELGKEFLKPLSEDHYDGLIQAVVTGKSAIIKRLIKLHELDNPAQVLTASPQKMHSLLALHQTLHFNNFVRYHSVCEQELKQFQAIFILGNRKLWDKPQTTITATWYKLLLAEGCGVRLRRLE